MTDLDFLRFIMASPATTAAGGQGGMGQQLFPELLQRLMQIQMQQSGQGTDNERAYMQLALMPGNVLGGVNDRYQEPPPPGTTYWPRGRMSGTDFTPERFPIRPRIPGTLDEGLKTGPDREIPWRQLPWWSEV